MNEKLVLSSENTKLTTKQIGRGRMKITIKFTKEESEAFIKFKNAVLESVPELNEDQFYKHLFFKGATTLEQELTTKMMEFKDQLEKQKADAIAAQNILEGNENQEVKS